MTQAFDLGAVVNGSGASVRSRFNTNVRAVTTESEGSDSPNPTYGFMWWRNDTAGLLRRRNAANSGWDIAENYKATTDPAANSDNTAGYVRGSQWINTTGNKWFVCVNPATGAADWQELGKPRGSPINVRQFGAVGDGSADDTDAFQDALTAAAGGILYIPPGVYKLSSALTLSNAAVTIAGAGLGVTELRWTAAASSRGITLSANSSEQFFLVRDIRFTTLGTTGTGLTLDYSDQIVDVGGGSLNTMDRIKQRFLVEACMFSGAALVDDESPWTNAWAVGVDIIAGLAGAVRDCLVCGLADTAYSAASGYKGLLFRGNPASGSYQNGHPVQFIIDNYSGWFCDEAVAFYNVEGAFVTNSNIVASNYGVYFLSESAGHPQLCVTNSHSNCYVCPILVSGGSQINISGCLLYIIQTAPSGTCISLTGSGHTGTICGNTCASFSTNGNGIVVNNYSYLALSNNAFLQIGSNMVSCIWLAANASNCKGTNNIFNGTFTYTVLDQGSNNVVT